MTSFVVQTSVKFFSLSASRVAVSEAGWGEGRGEVPVHFQARNEPLTKPVVTFNFYSLQ
jgi:hypothetical protein